MISSAWWSASKIRQWKRKVFNMKRLMKLLNWKRRQSNHLRTFCSLTREVYLQLQFQKKSQAAEFHAHCRLDLLFNLLFDIYSLWSGDSFLKKKKNLENLLIIELETYPFRQKYRHVSLKFCDCMEIKRKTIIEVNQSDV